jgi:hypothetical protein
MIREALIAFIYAFDVYHFEYTFSDEEIAEEHEAIMKESNVLTSSWPALMLLMIYRNWNMWINRAEAMPMERRQ